MLQIISLDDLPPVDECGLILPVGHLEPDALSTFDDRRHSRFNDTAACQADQGEVADFELSIVWLLRGWHARESALHLSTQGLIHFSLLMSGATLAQSNLLAAPYWPHSHQQKKTPIAWGLCLFSRTTFLLLVDLPLTTPPCRFSSLVVGPGGRSGSFLAREKMSLSALRRPNLLEDFEISTSRSPLRLDAVEAS